MPAPQITMMKIFVLIPIVFLFCWFLLEISKGRMYVRNTRGYIYRSEQPVLFWSLTSALTFLFLYIFYSILS